MLVIKNVTIKNFLSCGSVTQVIELDKTGLILVLGENLDLGGNGSRIAVGKTTLLQAISFGLYGQPLTNIRVNNLINNINQKHMIVTIEFEKNGHNYKIERGRKPNFFRYIVDGNRKDDSADEAQGEGKETQKEIDQVLGMSHLLFKHIVAMNSYTEPFLTLGAQKQREIIEELLGITLLSQKAENLKLLIKNTKTAIEKEEFRIKTVKQSNERIQISIDEINKKSTAWELKRTKSLSDIKGAIESLEKLNIDEEIQSHRDNELFKQKQLAVNTLQKELSSKTKLLNQYIQNLNSTVTSYEQAKNHECPTCGQELHDQKSTEIIKNLETKLVVYNQQVHEAENEINELNTLLSSEKEDFTKLKSRNTIYANLEQALKHQNTVSQFYKDLDRETNSVNPYKDQTNTISVTLQEVSYDTLNLLASELDHQEFLLKLLTNKDSFIRKKIMDQNLSYLNHRLGEYLEKLGLPHSVKFQNDLTVEIQLFGQDLDFDNLSRGERTTLVLGLSWAFRDIFENAAHAINLVFVDELLDMGLDARQLENSVQVLERMQYERNKNIFVISHREYLMNRINSILTVIKKNNFTQFSWDYSHQS